LSLGGPHTAQPGVLILDSDGARIECRRASFIWHERDAGGVMINDSTDYRLDSMPFGGIKNSGLGR
jgi:acyl-CoA reductase-like NAD-dependent aldehyde dehydrogenase